MEQQRGVRLIMTVDSMEPHASEKYAMYFDPVHTKVIVSSDVSSTPKTTPRVLQLKSDGIGGLSGHIATIDRTLAFLAHAAPNLPDPYLLGPTALLLHGPEGTGKTMLLERLAACPWMEVYRLNSETHPKGQVKGVSDVFEEALENQPSLVLMDNLDKFLEKADSLVSRLRTELARLEGSQVVVAAAARSIYDVDTSLRTTSAFKTEIEFFPPNVRQREDILRQILGPTRAISSINFGFLATRSHGFVGRDIHKLCGLARNRRVQRAYESLDDERKATIGEILEKTDFITQEDFDAIIDQVQPTVLKESILEVPKVRWTDIAGLDHVRSLLEAITIRPFKVRWSSNKKTTMLITRSTLISTSSSVGPSRAKACSCSDRQAAQRR
jgi:AAA family ATPase